MPADPTSEIAIGRKMNILAYFSLRSLSLSVSVATARPKATVSVGTTIVQMSVLTMVLRKDESPKRLM